MKTAEELTALKEEMESLKKKLCELTEEEMVQVTGGLKQSERCGHNKTWEPDI